MSNNHLDEKSKEINSLHQALTQQVNELQQMLSSMRQKQARTEIALEVITDLHRDKVEALETQIADLKRQKAADFKDLGEALTMARRQYSQAQRALDLQASRSMAQSERSVLLQANLDKIVYEKATLGHTMTAAELRGEYE